MARTRPSKRIRRYLWRLGQPGPRKAISAEQALIRLGRRVLPAVLAATASPAPRVRFRAAWILGKAGDRRAWPALVALADDPDERVRYDAVMALGVLGDPRSIDLLVRLVAESPRADSLDSAAAMSLVRL